MKLYNEKKISINVGKICTDVLVFVVCGVNRGILVSIVCGLGLYILFSRIN